MSEGKGERERKMREGKKREKETKRMKERDISCVRMCQ